MVGVQDERRQIAKFLGVAHSRDKAILGDFNEGEAELLLYRRAEPLAKAIGPPAMAASD
jgi:hypothetical protein